MNMLAIILATTVNFTTQTACHPEDFKHYDTAVIDKFIEAVHKVAKNVDKLRGIKPDESSVRRRFTAG